MIRLLLKSYKLVGFKYKLILLAIVCLGIVISFFEVLSIGVIFPIMEMLVYDNVEDSKFYNFIKKIYVFQSKESLFKFIAISTLIIFVGKNILLAFSKYIKDSFLFDLRNNLEVDFFSQYLSKSLLFHKNTNSAKLITNLTSEISILIKSVLLGSLEFFSALLIILFSLTMIIFVNYYISLFIIVLILFLYFTIIRGFRKKVEYLGQDRSKFTTARQKLIQESFNSIYEVKNNFLEKNLSQNLKKILFKISKSKLYIYFLSFLPQVISEIVIIIILFVGFIYAINNNLDLKTYLPEISLIILTFIRLSPLANKMINIINSIIYAEPTVNRLSSGITNLNNKSLNETKEINQIKLQDRIKFNSVSFSYEDNFPILENLNLEIIKGSMVGINGSSGSGKTTLLNLLSGFYEPKSGEVLVDGKNINDLSNYRDWLVNIGYVPQRSFIFDDTIYNNITLDFFNNNLHSSNLDKVLKDTQLTEFIDNLDKGINTNLGELGSKISGGQKQRIALARALYHKKNVIILDESTNSLDKITEEKFLKNLKALKKTVILVSHDMAAMKYCDCVYKVENRKISKIQ